MASLHRDPRGRSPFWFCAYSVRDVSGKLVRRFRSTKTSDKKQAREVCNTWAKASSMGSKLSPDKARQVIADGVADILMSSGQTLPSASIKDWTKRWLETKELEAEPRTHERYKTSIRRFIKFLGTKAGEDLEALKVNDVLKFREFVSNNLSTTSTNMDLKVLRACLYSAQKQDLVQTNVAAKVDTLKQRGGSKRRGFTLQEITRLIEQAKQVGGEWPGLILTGLYTGQRLGDVAQLTWQQVDFEKHRISFETRKTGKRLSMHLYKPLAEELETRPSSDDPAAFVFPKAGAMAEKHSGTVSTKFYDEIMAPAGLAAARPKAKAKRGGHGRDAKRQTSELSFHSLRHTFTTWLKSAGASNALAQMIVGHDSEVVSRGYTHLDADDTTKIIEKLPDVTK